MWTKNSSVLLSKGLIILGIIMTFAISPLVPSLAEWYVSIFPEDQATIQITVVVYFSLVLVIILLVTLFRLLTNISRQIIFVNKNTTYLRIISWCCFIIAMGYLILGIWVELGCLIAFVAGFIGLILRVLKNVFAEAVSLQEENDYTI